MASAVALDTPTYLEGVRAQTPVASTIPENGDPYGVVVAPVWAGRAQRGDFNDRNVNQRVLAR